MIQKQAIAIAIADKRERMTATPQSPFLQSDLQGARVADNIARNVNQLLRLKLRPKRLICRIFIHIEVK